jgi:hypothetical protein
MNENESDPLIVMKFLKQLPPSIMASYQRELKE